MRDNNIEERESGLAKCYLLLLKVVAERREEERKRASLSKDKSAMDMSYRGYG